MAWTSNSTIKMSEAVSRNSYPIMERPGVYKVPGGSYCVVVQGKDALPVALGIIDVGNTIKLMNLNRKNDALTWETVKSWELIKEGWWIELA